jgi:acyl carrier protein
LVVLREDGAGEQRLVAYVVPTTDVGAVREPPSPGRTVREPPLPDHDLRAFLKARLPAYMLPAAFVALDQLPLTPNGKVDRRALPAPDADLPSSDVTFVAPRTATEMLLADIWAEALGLERVGVNDDFFDLGGHSLLVFRVMARVRRAVQLHVPMNSLQKSRTIASLAEYIELLRWARHISDTGQDDASAIREEGEV